MKRLLIALVMLTVLLIPAGVSLAQTVIPANDPLTTYSCIATGSAAVPSVGGICPDGTTKQVGALGAYSIVSVNYTNVNPGTTVFARCAVGQVVIGGGVALGSLNGGADITASRPSGVTGWAAAYRGTKHSLKVYAICATSA